MELDRSWHCTFNLVVVRLWEGRGGLSLRNNRSIKIRDLFSSFKPATPLPILSITEYMCHCRDCSGMNFFFPCTVHVHICVRCYFRNGSLVKPSSKPSNYSSSRCRAKLGPFRCQIKFSSPKFHCCLIILRARPSRPLLGEKFRDIFCVPPVGNCGNSSLLTAMTMFFGTTRIPLSGTHTQWHN